MKYRPDEPNKWDKKINLILKDRTVLLIGNGVLTQFRGEDGTYIRFRGNAEAFLLMKKLNNAKYLYLKNIVLSQIYCLYESY